MVNDNLNIEYYLTEILTPELLKNGIKYRFIVQICDDIRHRMHSLLSCWDDEKIRKTILFPSYDEAMFYEPEAKPYVREFVVTTIRNSMFEIAASDSFVKFKMTKILSNEVIKNITSTAVSFFDKFNFEAQCIALPENENIYLNVKNKYKLAWNVLYELANLEDREKNLIISEENSIMGIDKNPYFSREKNRAHSVVLDGYTMEFDSMLYLILQQIEDGEREEFHTPSFKYISRNFEKVLCVIQKILECDGKICTGNYYMSKTYIKKNKTIISPRLAAESFEEKMKKTELIPL